jgi:phage terminase small subunit
MGSSAKEAAFIREYPIDFNGTQAAIRAKYSKKTAGQTATKLLKKAVVREAIKKVIEKSAIKNELSMDRVLLEYKRLSLFDIRKLYDENGAMKNMHDIDDDTAAALISAESDDIFSEDGKKIGHVRKLKGADKRAALSDVMRHLGGFEKDNAQQAGGQKTVIVADIKDLSPTEKMKALQSIL